MRTFVESLKRLYDAGRYSDTRIAELLVAGKISQSEYEYIVGE